MKMGDTLFNETRVQFEKQVTKSASPLSYGSRETDRAPRQDEAHRKQEEGKERGKGGGAKVGGQPFYRQF